MTGFDNIKVKINFKTIMLFIFSIFKLNVYSQDDYLDYNCSFVNIHVDKFNGDKKYSYRSALLNSSFNIKVTKIITVKDSLVSDTAFYITLRGECKFINKEAKGVYFLFSDKTKIAYPDHIIDLEFSPGYFIDSNYTNSTYIYVATVKMDKYLLEKVSTLDITDVKLNTESQNFQGWKNKKENKHLRKALKCMKLN